MYHHLRCHSHPYHPPHPHRHRCLHLLNDDGVADPHRIQLRIKLNKLDVNATKVDLRRCKITSDDLILIVERLKEMPNLVELNLRDK